MTSGFPLNDHQTGLYIVVPLYFCVLLACALWANYKNRHTFPLRHVSYHATAAAAAATSHGHHHHHTTTSTGSGGVAPVAGTNNNNNQSLRSTGTIASNNGMLASTDDSVVSLSNHHHNHNNNLHSNNSTTNTTSQNNDHYLGLQSADTLSSHYLGARDLGPILTTGTIFASFFSGYTVIGIPNEAYHNGWLALRWVAGGSAIMMGFVGTGLRLRKAAMVRNHKTPLDFITDRFQSQLLRYSVLLLQIVPSMFYITAQVVALKSTFNSVFHLDPDVIYPVVTIMAITLFFEWLGGLRSVAMTDCVQSLIIVVAYVCLPPIVYKHFGGWADLDPLVYPKPEFYQTPTRTQQLDFWQFTLSLFSFFTFPHLMQRIYAAKDLRSLKCGFVGMACGMWFLMFGAVFLGTMAVQILQQQQAQGVVDNPFTYLLGVVADLGGFPKAIALITIVAALAAIMSTADSLLVAISQLVTEEVVYPIAPNASPSHMVWVGRAASFGAVVISTFMGYVYHRNFCVDGTDHSIICSS